MNQIFTILLLSMIGCRPASDVIDKSSKTESTSYRPGEKITITVNEENPIPLFTADASLICSDLTFYDPNGVLLQGTRNCTESLPECGEDGAVDCRATATFPAVPKAELENKIIAGESLAGIEGAATGGDYSVCTGAGQSACIATTTYRTMDLSSADPSTDLTASNFNATIATAGNFEFWDATGTRHVVSGDSNLTAVNIKDGMTIFGVAGSLTGAPATCSSDGEGSCLVDGTNYRAAVLAGAASKILSGQTLAGVSGNVTLPAQGTVLTGTNYGVGGTGSSGTLTLPSAANVLASSGNYGNPGSQITPTYSPDFPDLANVRAGDTVNGASGTLDDCSSDGSVGCVVVGPSYAAAVTTGADDKILSGQSIAGVNGNVTLPAAGKVLTGTSYGVSGTGSSGTLTLPDAGDVLTGSGTYGDPGSAITPSYSPDFPDVANVRSSDSVNGANGTLSDCSGGGSTGCVTTATYPSMNLATTGGTGLTNANFATAVSSSSTYEFWDASGARHTVTGDTDLSVGNLKDGVEIHGVTGDYPSASYPLAANTGATDLTSLGSGTTAGAYEFFDSTGAVYTTTVADGGTITPTASQQDFAGASTVYNGFSVAGDADLVATNIKSGTTIFGVAGSVTESPANCSSDGSQNCVATGSYYAATACGSNGVDTCYLNPAGSYDAADLTNLAAGNIKSGVTIAGQLGDYPSSTYPLPSASGTADLDSATFNAKVKSVSAFEYWASDGSYQTGSGDADIAAANIADGVDIFGTTGTATVGGGSVCTHATQGPCEADAACRWESGACEVNPWNIRTGVTLEGTAGSFKGNCRNRANSSIFDTDSMPPGNSADTSGSTLDWWDTIDNWDGDNNSLPSEQPVGWTAAHFCGKEVWSDLTADGACDSATDDCLMKDNLTGLIWSESYPVASTAAASTTRDWSSAVEHCENLSYGSRTDWRLPTQIELFTAYNHGLRELGFKGGGTQRPGGDTLDNNSFFISWMDDYFWSSTSRSDSGNTHNAANLQFTVGYATMNNKVNTHQVLCVAP